MDRNQRLEKKDEGRCEELKAYLAFLEDLWKVLRESPNHLVNFDAFTHVLILESKWRDLKQYEGGEG
jgi:hypothetical protein